MTFWTSSLNLEDYKPNQMLQLSSNQYVRSFHHAITQNFKKIKSLEQFPPISKIQSSKSQPKNIRQQQKKYKDNKFVVFCQKQDLVFKPNCVVKRHQKKVSINQLNQKEGRNKKIPSFLEKIIQEKDVKNRNKQSTQKNNEKSKFDLKLFKEQAQNRELQEIGNLRKFSHVRKRISLTQTKGKKQIKTYKSQQNFPFKNFIREEFPLKQINKTLKNVLDQFYIVKQLGKGQYGSVILAIQKYVGVICAIKIIEKKKVREDQSLRHLINQMKIQLFINHPNVIKMFGFLHDSEAFYILMQPALDGPLKQFITKKNTIPETQAIVYVKQIASAIKCLHQNQVIHRDLKSQNMLLHNDIVKICDFGWSTHHSNLFRQTFCGTPLYLSPQILTCQKYNEKVDVWSLGVLIYEMVTGSYPFIINSQRQMVKIVQQQIIFSDPDKLSNNCLDFIKKCLTKNPNLRPSVFQLLNHQYLANQQ